MNAIQELTNLLASQINNLPYDLVAQNILDEIDRKIKSVANEALLKEWQAIATNPQQQAAAFTYKNIEGRELKPVLNIAQRLFEQASKKQEDVNMEQAAAGNVKRAEAAAMELDNPLFDNPLIVLVQTINTYYKKDHDGTLSIGPKEIGEIEAAIKKVNNNTLNGIWQGLISKQLNNQRMKVGSLFNLRSEALKLIPEPDNNTDAFILYLKSGKYPVKFFKWGEPFPWAEGIKKMGVKKFFETKHEDILKSYHNVLPVLTEMNIPDDAIPAIISFLEQEFENWYGSRDRDYKPSVEPYLIFLSRYPQIVQSIVQSKRIEGFLTQCLRGGYFEVNNPGSKVNEQYNALNTYVNVILHSDELIRKIHWRPDAPENRKMISSVYRLIRENPELRSKLPLLFSPVYYYLAQQFLPYFPKDKLEYPGDTEMKAFGVTINYQNYDAWIIWAYMYKNFTGLFGLTKEIRVKFIDKLARLEHPEDDYAILERCVRSLIENGDSEIFENEIYPRFPQAIQQKLLNLVITERRFQFSAFRLNNVALRGEVVKLAAERNLIQQFLDENADYLTIDAYYAQNPFIDALFTHLSLKDYIDKNIENKDYYKKDYVAYLFYNNAEARKLILEHKECNQFLDKEFKHYAQPLLEAWSSDVVHIDKAEKEFLSKLPADKAVPFRKILNYRNKDQLDEIYKTKDFRTISVALKTGCYGFLIHVFYHLYANKRDHYGAPQETSLEVLLFLDEIFLELLKLPKETSRRMLDAIGISDNIHSPATHFLSSHFEERRFPMAYLTSEYFLTMLKSYRRENLKEIVEKEDFKKNVAFMVKQGVIQSASDYVANILNMNPRQYLHFKLKEMSLYSYKGLDDEDVINELIKKIGDAKLDQKWSEILKVNEELRQVQKNVEALEKSPNRDYMNNVVKNEKGESIHLGKLWEEKCKVQTKMYTLLKEMSDLVNGNK